MKLNCGPDWNERFEAKQKWHRFFALWPRRVGPGDCRWLEYVERKGAYFGRLHGWWSWEYRAIDPSPKSGV